MVYVQKALVEFARKAMVIHVDERLSIVLEMHGNVKLGTGSLMTVRAYACVGSNIYRKGETLYSLKLNSRLFQLYQKSEGDTFVWMDFEPFAWDSSQQQSGCPLLSIALQKIDQELPRIRERVQKHRAKGFEMYVITNQDPPRVQVEELFQENEEPGCSFPPLLTCLF